MLVDPAILAQVGERTRRPFEISFYLPLIFSLISNFE